MKWGRNVLHTTIYLIPLCDFDASHLTIIVENIETQFVFPLKIGSNLAAPSCAVDPVRNQVNSNIILKQLNEVAPSDALKVVGIAGFDLFNPIFSFVFGEAQFEGKCAVVSTYRLHGERDEKKPRRYPPVILRLEKEVVHELGHTFGLRHCSDRSCVMHFSPGLESVDRKSPFYCPVCQELLCWLVARELGRHQALRPT